MKNTLSKLLLCSLVGFGMIACTKSPEEKMKQASVEFFKDEFKKSSEQSYTKLLGKDHYLIPDATNWSLKQFDVNFDSKEEKSPDEQIVYLHVKTPEDKQMMAFGMAMMMIDWKKAQQEKWNFETVVKNGYKAAGDKTEPNLYPAKVKSNLFAVVFKKNGNDWAPTKMYEDKQRKPASTN